MKAKLVGLSFFCIVIPAVAAPTTQQVSATTRTLFEKLTPCPGKKIGEDICTGYIMVYVDPLCNGGKDSPTNVNWLPMLDLKNKQRHDQTICHGG